METEVIHVMFYNEVYIVALGPSVYLLITPAKAQETYCVQSIHLRATTPITESHASLATPSHTSYMRLEIETNHMPPDSRYQSETKKI